MLKKIGLGLAGLIVLFAVVVATRPATFHYERSTSIATTADVPYAAVSDFHRWAEFSPWEKLDPSMKKSYEGASSGVGAQYAWVGNDKVGEGRMTIEELQPDQSVKIKLEFLKPFAATNTATFTFTSEAGNTKVTWAMDGENNFVSKAAGLFMDMDKMIGSDFEKGLAELKKISEAEAEKRAEAAGADAAVPAAPTAEAPPADAAAPAPEAK